MTREHYLTVLGLDPCADWEQVQRTYSELTQVLKPELFTADAGLSRIAAERRAAVEEAYRFLSLDPVMQARQLRPDTTKESPGPQPVCAKRRDPIEPDSMRCLAVVLGLALLGAFLCVASFSNRALLEQRRKQQQLAAEEAVLDAFKKELAESITPVDEDEEEEDPASNTPVSASAAETFNAQSESTSENIAVEPAEQPFAAGGSKEFADVLQKELARISDTEFKEKDKLYTLAGNEPPKESFINFTPDLLEAAVDCDSKTVQTLLEKGVNINTVDDRGDSALSWAVRRKCPSVVRLLLARGANANIKSQNGFTPYVWARIYRLPEIEKMLVEAGATTSGLYWWRFDRGSDQEWLELALSQACANKDCSKDGKTATAPKDTRAR